MFAETMKRKFVIAVVLADFLLFTSCGFGVVYGLDVIINADGTISPDTAPMQREGNVYTLTDDVAAITVTMNNMILDGNGYTLTGGGKTMAVYVGSKNVTITNLIILGSDSGICLDYVSSNVTVTNNTIRDTGAAIPWNTPYSAIDLWGGGNHTIIGNQLIGNYVGVRLAYNTVYNVIVANNITANDQGISLWGVSNNSFHNNTFINNTQQISLYDSASTNIWDKGEIGNFWSDYNGTDSNNDGIGDTPYIIDENNQDNYPLMHATDRTANPEFPLWIILPLLLAAILAAVLYRKKLHKTQTKQAY
ncbi:MAG: NosD domain-containing protein [Candidatus Bathyarchaeota archaeon]|jgi:parallel beta-helix repeat protein